LGLFWGLLGSYLLFPEPSMVVGGTVPGSVPREVA
jgi:hypothetical protein